MQDIVTTRRGEVRRAKLYYLRDRVGKRTRVKELLGAKLRKVRDAAAVAQAAAAALRKNTPEDGPSGEPEVKETVEV